MLFLHFSRFKFEIIKVKLLDGFEIALFFRCCCCYFNDDYDAGKKQNETKNEWKKSKNRTCPTAVWLNYSQLMHEFVKCNRNDGIHLKMLMTRTFFQRKSNRRTHKEKRDSNNDNYNQIENHKIGGNRSTINVIISVC